MRSVILSITAFLFFSAAAMAQQNSLFDKLLFVSKGDTLPYRLLKPVSPESMTAFPLVIFLHGSGERGNDNEVQIKHIQDLFLETKYRSKYPCYVLAPQCPKNARWANFDNGLSETPTRPMQALINLIDKISKEFPIDKNRIYITGLSMGGYGTWDLIARYPDKFAAAVPICGGGDKNTASKIKSIPIWAFHGAKDNVVPPAQSRDMIKAIQDAGGSPGYTEYPDIAHDSWVQAYKEPHLVHWLFAQQLGGGKVEIK